MAKTAPVAAKARIDVFGDNVPPTTTAMLTPEPNAAGWNNADMQFVLTAIDNPGGSGDVPQNRRFSRGQHFGGEGTDVEVI